MSFDEWQEHLGPARRKQQKLIAAFPRDCRRLAKNLEKVMTCWTNMEEYGGQYELARNARNFETTAETYGFVQTIDELLQSLLAGAHTAGQQEEFSYRGARLPILP